MSNLTLQKGGLYGTPRHLSDRERVESDVRAAIAAARASAIRKSEITPGVHAAASGVQKPANVLLNKLDALIDAGASKDFVLGVASVLEDYINSRYASNGNPPSAPAARRAA